MQYGQLPLSNNGCGLIATYNVLFDLTKNENIDFPAIIKDLESDGIILNGAFGTSMVAIKDYFEKNGFKAIGSCKVEEFNKIGEEYDAMILTVYNNLDDITGGMHFMAITKQNGVYKVHNNFIFYTIIFIITMILSIIVKKICDLLTRKKENNVS